MNKRILLINPGFQGKSKGLNIPLGLMCVGSCLFHQGYNVNILDANNAKQAKGFFNKIRQELSNAVRVGLSVMSAQIPHALEISKHIRQCDPSIPIIWGGVHPTLYPVQTAKSEYVDFVVKGEGEITSFELLAAIEGGKNFREVKGIAFQDREHQEVIVTDDRELMDMNRLPPIEWQLLEDIRHIGSLREVDKLTLLGIPLQTSRGCPHRCAFCIDPILKQKYRLRETDLVLRDIERLIDLGVERIYFIDENFFVNKKRVMEIADGIEKRALNFQWSGSVRADYFRTNHLNLDLLVKLRRSGCKRVGIGAESGSQKILDKLKKDITAENILNAAELLSEAGISANFSFMIGLPRETADDVKKTLQLIGEITSIDTAFKILGPQIYRPYPGSELYFQCLRLGMKEPNTLTEWADSPYIERDISPKHAYMYPWIEYPIEDLHNLIFYASLLGINVRYSPITKLVRRIASARCKAFYFKYPVEREIFNGLDRIGVGKFLGSRIQL